MSSWVDWVINIFYIPEENWFFRGEDLCALDNTQNEQCIILLDVQNMHGF